MPMLWVRLMALKEDECRLSVVDFDSRGCHLLIWDFCNGKLESKTEGGVISNSCQENVGEGAARAKSGVGPSKAD